MRAIGMAERAVALMVEPPRAAWASALIDRNGAKVGAVKVAAPVMATAVIDRAIEVFGGASVSGDTPLTSFYAWARVLRIVDGRDAVHLRSVAREELRRDRPIGGSG